MKLNNTYTQDEVDANIIDLTRILDNLTAKRTAITQNINAKKKQIEYWKSLDKSQTKIF